MKLSDRICKSITKQPKRFLLFGILLVVTLSSGLLKFSERHDVRIWFRDNDPQIETLDQFEKQFGNDESVIIVINSKSGIFDQESMSLLKELTEKAWLIPQVIRVDSLTNFSYTVAKGDEIITSPFIPEDISTLDYHAKLKEALAHRVIPGYLLSKNSETALIFARIVPSTSTQPNYKLITDSLRELLSKYEGKGDHQFYMTGQVIVNDAFRDISNQDLQRFLPILFLLIIVLLLVIFKKFKGMLYPMIVTVSSLLCTLGTCFLIGFQFNSILSIIPGIIVSISIADAVHLVATYIQFKEHGEVNSEAVRKALVKNFLPTLLTSVSTTIGFLSLANTELMPVRQMGIVAGIGCSLAWLISYSLLGPLLTIFPIKVDVKSKKNVPPTINPLAIKFAKLIKTYQIPIVIVFSSITIMSLYLSQFVQINSNAYKYFDKKTQVRKANDFVNSELGGASGPELIIYSGKENGIKDPIFLRKVEEYKQWINDKSFVNKTIDIIDIIKEMNQSLNGGDPSFYKIPDSKEAIAEEIFLYQMGLPQGMDLNNKISLNYESMRMSILWSLNDTRKALDEMIVLEEKAKEMGLNLKVTGKWVLFQRMMNYVVKTFISSILLAFVLVSILMMIIFKSVKIGLLSLVPNVIPLTFGASIMYFGDIYLNFGTSLVFSVCLGIAVDDTIHFLSNYQKLTKEEGKSPEQAITEVFSFTGNALIITTVILVLGFGLFMFGDFVPNVHFGLMCAGILTSALLIDLIFLPALLLPFKFNKSQD